MEPKLTTADWSEVYYALESKALDIEEGRYGPDDGPGDSEEWAAHLREIMAKIEASGISV